MSAIHNNEASNEVKGNQIIMSRLLNAPRELVWEVFTDPQHLANWWGPYGFTTTTHEMNVDEGKNWFLTMHGPDGTDYPNYITYTEVVKPERLVFKHTIGKNSKETHHTTIVTLKEEGAKTRLVFIVTLPDADRLEELVVSNGVVEGGKQTMARMEEYLINLQSVKK